MKNSNKSVRSNVLYFLISFTLFLSGLTCFGQDTIITRKGEIILGNVMEVTPVGVKYKKIEMADGPVYEEDKALIEKIKYKSGYIDVFPEMKPAHRNAAKIAGIEDGIDYRTAKLPLKRAGTKYMLGDKLINEKQFHKMLLSLNNPEITYVVGRAKKAKVGQFIGFGAIPLLVLGGGLLALSTSEIYPEESATRPLGIFFLTGGTALFGTSIYFSIDRKMKNRKAVKLYKQQYE